MLGIGYFVGIAITGVLIFFLDVPLAESLAKWLSAVLGVVLAISFVVWRRSTWLVEDAGNR